MSEAVTRPPVGRVYGRRRGRRLRDTKSRLLETGLGPLSIPLPEPPAKLDPLSLFVPRPAEIWLEIGFGGGEHLAVQAAAYPDIGFIGCEPFINGVSNLLLLLKHGGQTNARIFTEDARLLLRALPAASIGRAFLLFPDPWPKRRHEERRFLNPDGVALLASVLADGADLRIATDHPALAPWMEDRMARHAAFRLAGRAHAPPADWVPTRYEAKAREAGRTPVYLWYIRVARGHQEDLPPVRKN